MKKLKVYGTTLATMASIVGLGNDSLQIFDRFDYEFNRTTMIELLFWLLRVVPMVYLFWEFYRLSVQAEADHKQIDWLRRELKDTEERGKRRDAVVLEKQNLNQTELVDILVDRQNLMDANFELIARNTSRMKFQKSPNVTLEALRKANQQSVERLNEKYRQVDEYSTHGKDEKQPQPQKTI